MARLSKIVMSLALGLFVALVAFDNVTNYGVNYEYVRHVLSMDTTPPGNALTYRAITSPLAWVVAYDLIIAAEAAIAVLFLAGAVALWRARHAPAPVFARAKSWVIAAATLGFLLWFLGFMVVGGEWFAMWQSKSWNGQEAAFRFIAILMLVLVYVSVPEMDEVQRGIAAADAGDFATDAEVDRVRRKYAPPS